MTIRCYDELGSQDYHIGQKGFTGVAVLAGHLMRIGTLASGSGAIRLTVCTARTWFIRQTCEADSR